MSVRWHDMGSLSYMTPKGLGVELVLSHVGGLIDAIRQVEVIRQSKVQG